MSTSVSEQFVSLAQGVYSGKLHDAILGASIATNSNEKSWALRKLNKMQKKIDSLLQSFASDNVEFRDREDDKFMEAFFKMKDVVLSAKGKAFIEESFVTKESSEFVQVITGIPDSTDVGVIVGLAIIFHRLCLDMGNIYSNAYQFYIHIFLEEIRRRMVEVYRVNLEGLKHEGRDYYSGSSRVVATEVYNKGEVIWCPESGCTFTATISGVEQGGEWKFILPAYCKLGMTEDMIIPGYLKTSHASDLGPNVNHSLDELQRDLAKTPGSPKRNFSATGSTIQLPGSTPASTVRLPGSGASVERSMQLSKAPLPVASVRQSIHLPGSVSASGNGTVRVGNSILLPNPGASGSVPAPVFSGIGPGSPQPDTVEDPFDDSAVVASFERAKEANVGTLPQSSGKSILPGSTPSTISIPNAGLPVAPGSKVVTLPGSHQSGSLINKTLATLTGRPHVSGSPDVTPSTTYQLPVGSAQNLSTQKPQGFMSVRGSPSKIVLPRTKSQSLGTLPMPSVLPAPSPGPSTSAVSVLPGTTLVNRSVQSPQRSLPSGLPETFPEASQLPISVNLNASVPVNASASGSRSIVLPRSTAPRSPSIIIPPDVPKSPQRQSVVTSPVSTGHTIPVTLRQSPSASQTVPRSPGRGSNSSIPIPVVATASPGRVLSASVQSVASVGNMNGSVKSPLATLPGSGRMSSAPQASSIVLPGSQSRTVPVMSPRNMSNRGTSPAVTKSSIVTLPVSSPSRQSVQGMTLPGSQTLPMPGSPGARTVLPGSRSIVLPSQSRSTNVLPSPSGLSATIGYLPGQSVPMSLPGTSVSLPGSR